MCFLEPSSALPHSAWPPLKVRSALRDVVLLIPTFASRCTCFIDWRTCHFLAVTICLHIAATRDPVQGARTQGQRLQAIAHRCFVCCHGCRCGIRNICHQSNPPAILQLVHRTNCVFLYEGGASVRYHHIRGRVHLFYPLYCGLVIDKSQGASRPLPL